MTFFPQDSHDSRNNQEHKIEYIIRQQGGVLSLFPAQARPTRYRSTRLRMAYELSMIDFAKCQMYWITVAYGSARQYDYYAAARDFDLLIGRLRRQAKMAGSDLAVFDAQEHDSGGSWHMHALIAANGPVLTRRRLEEAWGRTIRCDARVSFESISCEEELRPRKLYLLKAGSRHARREAGHVGVPDGREVRDASAASTASTAEQVGRDALHARAEASSYEGASAAAPEHSAVHDINARAHKAYARAHSAECHDNYARSAEGADSAGPGDYSADATNPGSNEGDAALSGDICTLLQGEEAPSPVWHIRASESQLSRIQAEARDATVWLTREEFEAIRVKYFPRAFEDARVKRLRRWVDEDSARFSAFSAWLDIWIYQQPTAQPRDGTVAVDVWSHRPPRSFTAIPAMRWRRTCFTSSDIIVQRKLQFGPLYLQECKIQRVNDVKKSAPNGTRS